MKLAIAITTLLSCTLVFTGCSRPATQAEKGAAIGAIAGGIIGKSTGDHGDDRALVGATLGAIGGAAVGGNADRNSYYRR